MPIVSAGYFLVASSGYLVVAAVLGCSGVLKLRNLQTAAGQIENYQIVPRAAARYAARALAATETACALLLMVPQARRACLLIAGGLMVMFLAAMSLALARGKQIPCACFGGAGELDTVGLTSVLRTSLLGAIVVMSLHARTTATQPAQLLVAALLLVLAFLLSETARLLPWQRQVGGSA